MAVKHCELLCFPRIMGKTQGKIPLPKVGKSCKDFVARICGTDYYLVKPWVDHMAGWTEGLGSCSPFPRDGANSPFHMDMIKGLCLNDRDAWPYYGLDPQWDKDYMRKGGENWLTYAPYWYDRTNKKIKLPKIQELEKSLNHGSFAVTLPPPYNTTTTPTAPKGLYPSLNPEDSDLLAGYHVTQTNNPNPNPPNPVPQRPQTPPPQQPQQQADRTAVVSSTVRDKEDELDVEEGKDSEATGGSLITSVTERSGITNIISPSGKQNETRAQRIQRKEKEAAAATQQLPFMTVGDSLLKKVKSHS